MSDFELLGVRISTASFQGTLDRLIGAPERGEKLAIHFATVHSLVEASQEPRVLSALNAGVVEPDGMPLVWLGRLSGHRVERVCGPDLMPALMDAGRASGRRHYLYGGTATAARALARRLTARFPEIQIVGVWSPPFRSLNLEEVAADIKRINDAQPDYVWVGLGAPKQDLWTASQRPYLNAAAVLAVGAAFDFHAGQRRRAPRWMQRTGTEWLHRLASDPRRLARRYTVVNARFLWLLAKSTWRRRRS